MSDDESVCNLHNGNDSESVCNLHDGSACALENPQEHLTGQIVHRYVNNFHIHEGGESLKCGNCGAQKICPRCSVATAGKHQCEVCGIWISSNPRFIDDHMRIHTGERPFVCHLCEQSFKQSAHLEQHRRIHTRSQPYHCETCGASFSQQATLNAHQRCVHSLKRDFECNECAKTFKLRHSLMHHYRTKHGCGYDCPDCGQRLATRDAYTHHHTKHVKEKTTSESEAGHGNENTMEKINDETARSGI